MLNDSIFAKPESKQTLSSHDNHDINSRSLQNQTKRQHEWLYLAHYFAIQGLDPIHIISGLDDGRKPVFTLIF